VHPDAHRDITLNFTTIDVGVTGILFAIAGRRRRHAN
jgi:hypothetical protein